MKILIRLIPALLVAFVSTAALADNPADRQAEQNACQNDVYTHCEEAIPDEDKIAACLRKNWGKISQACRKVMKDHGRKGRHEHD